MTDQMTPEQLLQAAQAAADAAEASRKAADGFATAAGTAKDAAVTAAQNAAKDVAKEVITAVAKDVAIAVAKATRPSGLLNFFTGVLLLISAVAAAVSALKAYDSVKVSVENQAFEANQAHFAMLQQLEMDTQRLSERMNALDGVVEKYSELQTSGCELNMSIDDADAAALDMLANQILATYQKYYLATLPMGWDDDWQEICAGARNLRENRCLIDQRLTRQLAKTTPEFQEAMKSCKLPRPSKQQ